MKRAFITLVIVAILATSLYADDKTPTDNELALQKQVLVERMDKLRAQFTVAETELRAVIAEMSKRAEAKKAGKVEGKK